MLSVLVRFHSLINEARWIGINELVLILSQKCEDVYPLSFVDFRLAFLNSLMHNIFCGIPVSQNPFQALVVTSLVVHRYSQSAQN